MGKRKRRKQEDEFYVLTRVRLYTFGSDGSINAVPLTAQEYLQTFGLDAEGLGEE